MWIIINVKMTRIDWIRPQKISKLTSILIREWPQSVKHVYIYNHLILSRACDRDEIKKNTNRWTVVIILWVVPGKILQIVILRKKSCFKKVHLSQKINSEFHNKLVLCDIVGTFLTGGHVGAFLHRCLWTRLPPPLRYFLIFIS